MNRLRRLAAAGLTLSTLAVSGCYMVPVTGKDGNTVYAAYPVPPAHPAPGAVPPGPVTIAARLYPANDLANQTGMITGSVTNMRTGKGRFSLGYLGETLVGEATRHGNDDSHGVASAYGSKGTTLQCEYQMNTPVQGAGTCTFSNGARYTLHLGG